MLQFDEETTKLKGVAVMTSQSTIEKLLRHDQTVVLISLGIVIAISWAYILLGAGMGMSAFQMSSLEMAFGVSSGSNASSMPGMVAGGADGAMGGMTRIMPWTIGYGVLMFFMWWIMMIAMMLPSAAPTVLLYALVNRKAEARPEVQSQPWSTGAFTGGYLAAWAGFSLLAVTLQWLFEQTGLLSPMMLNTTSKVLAGSILLLAGIYQLTPLKEACLRHCRGPIQFLSQTWRQGLGGAFVMGLHHGAYCLGCCWGLMAILFFGGIMNLYWIIGLALIVLIEKLAPAGMKFGKILGVGLAAWGVWFLVSAL
jgi:predicted metal-binding membrane protein